MSNVRTHELFMHKLFNLTVCIALSVSASTAFSTEELSCNTETKLRGGASKGANLTLKVESGRVIFLSAQTFTSSGKEGGGYSCSVDSSSHDSKLKWSRTSSRTTLRITDESSGEESIVKITSLARGYKVSFEQMWQGYCGFGAEFPQSITLSRGEKRCTVVE